MKRRTFRLAAALALSVTLAAGGAARPAAAGARQENRGAESAELTPGEEREARALTERLVARLRETGDAGPLAPELFAEDFAERVREFVRAKPRGLQVFASFIDPQVVVQADPADIRRVCLALLNLQVQQDLASNYESRIIYGPEFGVRPTSELKYEPNHLTLSASLPKDFFKPGGDPLLRLLKAGFFGREEELEGIDEKVKAARVVSVERLRSFTAELEACVEALRRAVGRLRAEAESKARGADIAPGGWHKLAGRGVYKVESEIVRREVFGIPAGTLLVRVSLYPYVFVLARREGRLRVIGIMPDFDGD
jgi:hypothetical protein